MSSVRNTSELPSLEFEKLGLLFPGHMILVIR